MSTAVQVEQPASVDLKRPEGEVTQGEQGEETMAQYAARREAEMRGEKPEVVKQAAPADEGKTAAATEKSAAATDETKDGEKKPADSATEDDPEKLIEEAHPAKKGISKRMGELASARKAAEAAAETAKQEAAAAKAEATRLAAELEQARQEAADRVAAVPAAEEDPAPSRDAFDDPDEYQAAYTAHAARQEIRKSNEAAAKAAKVRTDEAAAKAETERQAKVQEQIVALHKTFNERVEAGKAEYPDYDAKVTNNEKLILRNDIFFTVEQTELPHAILYYLSDHPDETASLNTMPPIMAAMRIGEIQTELRIARKPKVSQAKEPVKPVRGRSSPEHKTPDEESMEEYAARREREEADKRAAARRRAH
ncbi:MAG TPA: hypothetical protein VMX35_08850 [Acidobacteriota bacterium]|nr:hypothetical protein [Acidobacteriota bacterium]